MEHSNQDKLMFFEGHISSLPLYEAFESELLRRFPGSKTRVQKSQITFSNRHVFACVSFLRVRKKAELLFGAVRSFTKSATTWFTVWKV